jgi:hypothetical protein
MTFVSNETITQFGKANSSSIFRRRVVDGNYEDLAGFYPDWEDADDRTKLDLDDTKEAERLIFNFLTSCQSWRDRWEEVYRKLDGFEEKEILRKLEKEYDPNKIAFLVHLRNFIVHNTSPSLLFEINNNETDLYIVKDQDLDQDVKNAEKHSDLERSDKMSEFYRNQSHEIDILRLAKNYHKAIVETDKWAIKRVTEKISE